MNVYGIINVPSSQFSSLCLLVNKPTFFIPARSQIAQPWLRGGSFDQGQIWFTKIDHRNTNYFNILDGAARGTRTPDPVTTNDGRDKRRGRPKGFAASVDKFDSRKRNQIWESQWDIARKTIWNSISRR